MLRNTLAALAFLLVLFSVRVAYGQATPVVGGPDDGKAHLPTNPSWGTADTTAKCGTYSDTLGSALGGTNATVKRLTNSATDVIVNGKGSPLMNLYSTPDFFNSNDSFVMLFTTNATYHGFFPERVSDCNILVTHVNMPTDMSPYSEPVWHPTDPNSFYYNTTGNVLKKATITGLPACGATNSCTVTTSVVHTFNSGGSTGSGYTNIELMDVASLSPDGSSIDLVGLNSNNTFDLLVYNIAGDTFTVEYTTASSGGCQQTSPSTVTNQPAGDCLHKMEWSGVNNHLTIDMNGSTNPGTGIWITNAGTLHALYAGGATRHHIGATDSTKTKDRVFQVAFVPSGDPCYNGGGMSYEDLSGGVPGTPACSFANDWAVGHLAGAAASLNTGYIVWNNENGSTPGPAYYSGDATNYKAPTQTNNDPTSCRPGSGDWCPWLQEIALTSVNSVGRTSGGFGSSSGKTYRIAWTRSADNENYFNEAKATISRDGQYVAWTSTFANASGCPTATIDCSGAGPVDVYMVGPLFTATPLCGVVSDGLNHPPDDAAWASFAPPSVGRTYQDTIGGSAACTVTRLTNNVGGGAQYGQTVCEYSTTGCFSATDQYLFMSNGDTWQNHYSIIDMSGNVIISDTTMNGEAFNNDQPRWDPTNDLVFYRTNANTIKKCTITASSHSFTCTVLHTFSEYASSVWFPGDSDVNASGWVPMSGQNTAGGTVDLFLYNLVTSTKSAVAYTTVCTGNNGNQPNGDCVHRLMVTPNNGMTMAFNGLTANNEAGDWLWEPGFSSKRQIQSRGNHHMPGKDLAGNEVAAYEAPGGYFDVGGTALSPCTNTYNPATVILSATMTVNQANACLMDVSGESNWHVSWINGTWMNATNGQWIVYSQQAKNDAERWNNDTNFKSPSTAAWAIYDNEILLVRVDANGSANKVYRLTLSHSRAKESYWAEPHAVISRDGKYIAFESNAGWSATGCGSDGGSSDCADTYLIGPIF